MESIFTANLVVFTFDTHIYLFLMFPISPSFLACSTCRVTMIDGGGDAAGWSIFFLLVVIVAMLIGVGYFMIRIVRREKANFDPSLTDDYVGSESTH
jgi:hypothetical protein